MPKIGCSCRRKQVESTAGKPRSRSKMKSLPFCSGTGSRTWPDAFDSVAKSMSGRVPATRLPRPQERCRRSRLPAVRWDEHLIHKSFKRRRCRVLLRARFKYPHSSVVDGLAHLQKLLGEVFRKTETGQHRNDLFLRRLYILETRLSNSRSNDFCDFRIRQVALP